MSLTSTTPYPAARWLALLVLLLLAACGGSSTAPADGRLRVVTTTGQLADAAANVGGDLIALESLMGPGIDPHLYVPTEGDLRTLSQAQVIIYNGLELEAQMATVMGRMTTTTRTVAAVGEQLPADQLLEKSAGLPDPHIWNDPALWQQVVTTIGETLATADPANAATYRANAAAYAAQIATAGDELRALATTIPPANRVLVTAHDAFGYYGRAFGLEVVGLQGLSTQSEASTADVQRITDLIVARNIPAIFVETSISPRTIESVQAAAAARGHQVAIGGTLYSDALGEAGSDAATYLGMLRANTRTIVSALGGTAGQ